PRLGAVHPPDGDGNTRFVDHRGRHRDPGAPRVRVRAMHHLPRRLDSDRTHHRLVPPKEARVDVDGLRVLDRDVHILEDRVHRAHDLALLAIDAHVRIDVELRGAGPGMDAGDRAHLDAGPIVGAETRDDVGHGAPGSAPRYVV